MDSNGDDVSAPSSRTEENDHIMLSETSAALCFMLVVVVLALCVFVHLRLHLNKYVALCYQCVIKSPVSFPFSLVELNGDLVCLSVCLSRQRSRRWQTWTLNQTGSWINWSLSWARSTTKVSPASPGTNCLTVLVLYRRTHAGGSL